MSCSMAVLSASGKLAIFLYTSPRPLLTIDAKVREGVLVLLEDLLEVDLPAVPGHDRVRNHDGAVQHLAGLGRLLLLQHRRTGPTA